MNKLMRKLYGNGGKVEPIKPTPIPMDDMDERFELTNPLNMGLVNPFTIEENDAVAPLGNFGKLGKNFKNFFKNSKVMGQLGNLALQGTINQAAGAVTGLVKSLRKGAANPNPGYKNTNEIMAMGGTVDNIPVEVEGGEVMETPNGEVMEIKGPDHEQGGVKGQLPRGTDIFSKRLMGRDGKDMAKRKKEREKLRSNLEKQLKERPSDKVLRNTADRILKRLAREEQEDMLLQQQAQQQQAKLQAQNMQMGASPNMGEMDPAMMQSMMDNTPQSMAYGGTVKKYDLGTDPYGVTDPEITPLSTAGTNYEVGSIPFQGEKNFLNKLLVKKTIESMGLDKGMLSDPTQSPSNDSIEKNIANMMGSYEDTPETWASLYNQPNMGQGNGVELPISEAPSYQSIQKGPITAPDIQGNPIKPMPKNTAYPIAKPTGPVVQTNKGPSYEAPDINRYNEKYPLTKGDIFGILNNTMGAMMPNMMTLMNRASDMPNINPYATYGQDGLNTISKTMGKAGQIRDNQLEDIELAETEQFNRIGQSARSVNQARGLQQAAYASGLKARGDVQSNYANQMMQLLGVQAQMQNQRDQMVMKGEEARDLADRQDKDNFYQQMSKDFVNAAGFGTRTAKAMNQSLQNANKMKLLQYASENGLDVEYDDYGNIKGFYDSTVGKDVELKTEVYTDPNVEPSNVQPEEVQDIPLEITKGKSEKYDSQNDKASKAATYIPGGNWATEKDYEEVNKTVVQPTTQPNQTTQPATTNNPVNNTGGTANFLEGFQITTDSIPNTSQDTIVVPTVDSIPLTPEGVSIDSIVNRIPDSTNINFRQNTGVSTAFKNLKGADKEAWESLHDELINLKNFSNENIYNFFINEKTPDQVSKWFELEIEKQQKLSDNEKDKKGIKAESIESLLKKLKELQKRYSNINSLTDK